MKPFVLIGFFPMFAFAAICGTETYKCKADNKMYTRHFCSGGAVMPPAAFCISTKGGDLQTCLADNSKQTEVCNKEYLSNVRPGNETSSGTQPVNVNRADIVQKIGSCTYKTDSGLTKVSEVKNTSCGTKKYICSFEAKCTKATSVTGQCFTDSGKCPADPIDCIAIRDIVGIRSGADAIDLNLRFDSKTQSSGTNR